MTFEDIAIDRRSEFIERLKVLSFIPVRIMMVKRKDLLSFEKVGGGIVKSDEPWFGEEIKKWGDQGLTNARPDYIHYFGFADDVFFRRSSRSDRRTSFIPLPDHKRPLTPVVGDILVGIVEPAPIDGRRFVWWDISCKQEQLFAEMMQGLVTVSQAKLERKLTVTRRDGAVDRTLLFAYLALRAEDLEYFVGLARRRERFYGDRGSSIQEWLFTHIRPIHSAFYDSFEERL